MSSDYSEKKAILEKIEKGEPILRHCRRCGEIFNKYSLDGWDTDFCCMSCEFELSSFGAALALAENLRVKTAGPLPSQAVEQ